MPETRRAGDRNPRQPPERVTMAGVLALLMFAGGVLGLITPLMPHAAGVSDSEHVVIGAISLFSAAAIWMLRRVMPPWGFQVGAAIGTLLVTASIHATDAGVGGASLNELFYLWPVIYSGYFFSRGGLGLQLGLIAVSYGVLLATLHLGHTPVGRWVATVTVLCGTGAFVHYLRERLDRDLSLQRATVESTTDGILVVDRDGRWVSFNRKFIDMWGIPNEITRSRDDDAAVGYVLEQLSDPRSFVDKVRELYDDPDAQSFDELRFKDGRVFERYSQPQHVDGRTFGRVWSFRDVTEQRRARERLQHLADHDPLTDLLNRRRLDEELVRLLSSRNGDAALLLLDLDDFKGVNDTHGHLWGDELLRRIARILDERLDGRDLLARLGGDEFAVLLRGTDAEGAARLAEELLGLIREHEMEVELGELAVTTSIGVVPLSPGVRPNVDPLVAADRAMYRAKREGRNRVAVFNPELDASSAIT